MAALRAAKEVEAAALVAPPPLPTPAPPLAPVRGALERPATAPGPTASAVAVRGSGTAPERPVLAEVANWWPIILGKHHRNPEDRAKALFPAAQAQVKAHGVEAVRAVLIDSAPSNLTGAWLTWRQVAERAKHLTKRGAEVWERLTRPPVELRKPSLIDIHQAELENKVNKIKDINRIR